MTHYARRSRGFYAKKTFDNKKEPNTKFMPTFRRTEEESNLLPEGIYAAQVDDCSELTSKRGNTMYKLELAVLPKRRRLFSYLVFSEKAEWQVTSFCKSAGLEMPDDKDAEISLSEVDCLRRIVYVVVAYEEGTDGLERPKVARFLTRDAALKRNPSLELVPLPRNVPPPKKLKAAAGGKPPETKLPVPVPVSAGDEALDAEPDDIPF
jgi:hypothetical protein